MNKDYYPIIIALIAGGSAIAGSLGGAMLQNKNTENSELEKRKTIVFDKVINSVPEDSFNKQIIHAIKLGLLPDPDNKILSTITDKISKLDCGLSVELSKFTYTFGEKIALQVSTKQPCYLLILSMDTNGEISKLYPSSQEESEKKIHNINFLNESSPIIASAPEGANIIFFMASIEKITLASKESIPMSRGVIKTSATTPAEGTVDILKMTQENSKLNALVRVVYTYKS